MTNIDRPESTQPIPNNAKKVFSGVLFDVYQWEQEQFDGSVATFEKLSRPDTVVVIPVTDNGTIILAEQEQPGKRPFISAVGGRIDSHETVQEAAKRELLEETGCTARDFVLWKAMHPTSKIDWVVYTLVARGTTMVQKQALDSGEKITIKEVDFDTFISTGMNPDFQEKEIVPDLIEAQYNTAKKQELAALLGISHGTK